MAESIVNTATDKRIKANEKSPLLEPEACPPSRHRFFYGWFVVMAAAVGMLLSAALKITRTLITICLLFTTATLIAQTTPSQRLMTVNVPFAFGVEGHSLPAGEYLASR